TLYDFVQLKKTVSCLVSIYAFPVSGRGQFPPMMQRHVTPDLRGQRGHGEVRGTGSGGAGSGGGGAGTGSGLGGKSNLAAQIIPVYGFGILLYILYILFKITSKGHSKPSQSRLHSLRSESSKRKITDFELSQLQERLRETELVMENLVNNSLQEEEDIVSLDQEQSLLQQLTEITRAMKSNHLQDFTNTTSPTEETGNHTHIHLSTPTSTKPHPRNHTHIHLTTPTCT
uniref:Resistance to inhibitors of cholinesterase protein 3 N-terminal domain-containing protein n=1 Tax=Neogobius melanostomus TaxID=47308 RepID=A0A8C6TUG6_9GOBI